MANGALRSLLRAIFNKLLAGDRELFGLFAEQVEDADEREDAAHGGQTHHAQDGDGVASLAGRVVAAVEQDDVAERPDPVIAGLDDGEADVARLVFDARE